MNVIKLLMVNMLRIMNKSKTIIFELILLLILGTTAFVAVTMSNNTLNDSYSTIATKGHMGDFTINESYNSNVDFDYDINQGQPGQPITIANPDYFTPTKAELKAGHLADDSPLLINVKSSLKTPIVKANDLVINPTQDWPKLPSGKTPTASYINKHGQLIQGISNDGKNITDVMTSDADWDAINQSAGKIIPVQQFSFLDLTQPLSEHAFVLNPESLVLDSNGIQGYYPYGGARVSAKNTPSNKSAFQPNKSYSLYQQVTNEKTHNNRPCASITGFDENSNPSVTYNFDQQGKYQVDQGHSSYRRGMEKQFKKTYDYLNTLLTPKNGVKTTIQSPTTVYQVKLDKASLSDANKFFWDGIQTDNSYVKYKQYSAFDITIPNDIVKTKADSIQLIDRAISQLKSQFSNKAQEYANSNMQAFDHQYRINDDLNKLPITYNYRNATKIRDSKANTFEVVRNPKKDYTDTKNPIDKAVLYKGSNLNKGNLKNEYNATFAKKLIALYNDCLKGHKQNYTWQDLIARGTSYNGVNYHLWDFFNLIKGAEWDFADTYVEALQNCVNVLSIKPTQSNFKEYQNKLSEFAYYVDFTPFSDTGYGLSSQVRYYKKNTRSMGLYLPGSIKIMDFGSYGTLVSPNYMNDQQNNKKPIDLDLWYDAQKLPFDLINSPNDYDVGGIQCSSFKDWMQKLPSANKITIDGESFVIIGTALSPDYMFPAMSKNQLLIDNTKTAILYTNDAGYKRVRESFGSSQESNYIVGKFNTDNKTQQKQILKQINQITKNKIGSKTAFLNSNASNPNDMVYTRTQFVGNLQQILTIASAVIMLITLLLCLYFLCTLTKSLINQFKQMIGASLANGCNKWEILLSFLPFAILPGLIGAFISYGIAAGLEPAIISLLSSYWTIPITGITFSWYWFIVLPLGLCLILYVVVSLTVLWELRVPTSSIIYNTNTFKMNKLISCSSRLRAKFSPMISFSASYGFGNINRFIALTFTSTAFMSMCAIALATSGNFTNAIDSTTRNKNYQAAVDLYSPTIQGGYYVGMPYQDIGTANPAYGTNNLYKVGPYAKTNPAMDYTDAAGNKKSYSNLYYPSTNSLNDFHTIQFFNQKVISKSFLDAIVAVGLLDINPWEFAASFLPQSISEVAGDNSYEFIDTAFNEYILNGSEATSNLWAWGNANSFIKAPEKAYQNNKYVNYNDWYFWKGPLENGNSQFSNEPSQNAIENAINDSAKPWIMNSKKAINGVKYNENFIRLLTTMYGNPKTANLDYKIATNLIALNNKKDETYTYINANLKRINNKPTPTKAALKLMGIKNNSNHVILYDKDNHDLKSLLTTTSLTPIDHYDNFLDGTYPIVINEVVAKKYGLKVNSELTLNLTNTLDRTIDELNNVAVNNPCKFIVKGITTSKSEQQIYLNQSLADHLLGYYKKDEMTHFNRDMKNKYANIGYATNELPFNGFFTNTLTPMEVTHVASVYNASGISPAIPLLQVGTDSDELYKKFSENWADVNKILDVPGFVSSNYSQAECTKLILKLIHTFGAPCVVSAITGADAVFANQLLGTTLDSTVTSVEMSSLVVLLPTILMIVILIATALAQESRRLLSVFKLLGISDLMNASSFMVMYGLVLIVSILITIPISFALLSGYAFLAFSYFSIIISPIPPWWIFLVTFLITAGIFLVAFISTLVKLKHMNLANALENK